MNGIITQEIGNLCKGILVFADQLPCFINFQFKIKLHNGIAGLFFKDIFDIGLKKI